MGPPPVWLNCPSTTPIIIIYHTLTSEIYIGLHCCRLFIVTLYVYVKSVIRICIFEIILLIFKKSLFLSYILRSDNVDNIGRIHFYKFGAEVFGSKKDINKASDINNSQFIIQINNERPDSSNNLRKRYVVYITEM